MPGQCGNEKVTILTQPVAKLVPDERLILVCGGVPGSRNGIVYVRGATKKRGGLKKTD